MPTPIEILLDPLSIVLLAIYASLILLEAIMPARKLPKIKGWYIRSITMFVVYFYLATYLPMFWDKYLLPYQIFDFSHYNSWLSMFVALFVFEFFIYVWHKAMHSNKLLWRTFHQMHHSAERIDSFGAFYFSPLDMIGFTFLGSLTLAIVVGISVEATTWFFYVTMFLPIFQHLNVKTPQWIGYIIQRPESHSIHHQKGVHRYNYSDLPVFDILFRTFKNPKHFVNETGLYEGASSKMKDMLMCKLIANPNRN